MNKIYSIILLVVITLISCDKEGIEFTEDDCYFKGKFGDSDVFIQHGDDVRFSNGTSYAYHANYYSYSNSAVLSNQVIANIPNLQIVFRNHARIDGEFSEEKSINIFPTLFSKGKYNFVTTFDEENEVGIYVRYQDEDGRYWRSVSDENKSSYLEIKSSEIVETNYYSSTYEKKVEGEFSCILLDESGTKRIKVSNVEFVYLYVSE